MRLPMYVLLRHILAIAFLCFHHQVLAADEVQPFINTVPNNDFFGFMDKFNGFTCEATGTNMKYFWKHKDQLITKDSPLKFPKLNSSTLQPIKQNIEITYEGPYQCFAQNSIGTVFGRKADVKFTVVGQFYRSNLDIETIKIKLNKPLAISCPRHRYSYNVKYKWEYVDGDESQSLPPKPGYFVTENGTLYFAIVTQANVDYINKVGGIHCNQRATYNGETKSRSSHRIKLQVKLPTVSAVKTKPEIKTQSSTKSVQSREKLVLLKCGAIGNPVPDLTWYREGLRKSRVEIKNGGGFKLARFNQYLSIEDVTTNKAGRYVCIANNSMGRHEVINHINVQDRPQWTVGGNLRDVQPPIENQFIWNCMALGGATFTWYKNGVKLDGTSAGEFEINQQPGNSYSSLIIKKMTIAYNGMYECTAANEKDTIYSIGRLSVKENKPMFTEAMGPITLIQTKNGRIPCPVDAAPLPKITWKKDKQRITYDSRIKLALNKQDLEIYNVSSEDKGVYLCHAQNNLGEAEDLSEVTIGVDISWVAKPVHNTNVTQGLKFELDCHAKGDPSYEVKYRWHRNGLPLEYSARVHWVKSTNRLVVLDSLVSDTGTYTCIAFAETPLYIYKSHDAMVEVKAPPNPPDYVAIESTGSCWNKNAKLVWRTASLNNEAELFYTLIEWSTSYEPANWTFLAKKEEGTEQGQGQVKEDGTELRLNFKLLPPYSQVSFRVILVNRIGASEPSQPSLSSDCVTGPSAPPYPPAEIKGEAHGSNTLTLVWTPVRQMYWGSAGFTYRVQFRRKTKNLRDSRWDIGQSHWVTIEDGHNNSLPVQNPGYFNVWEFRIKSQNRNGSSGWTYGTAFSGQYPPTGKPSGLTRDRISAKSADISWLRVTPPKNGSIDGYQIEYWRSVIGVNIAYKNSRKRKKRDDGEEEENIDYCFDPKKPCIQESLEKESQLTNLEPFKTYHIRIAAFNSGGRGPFSDEMTFETADDKPGPPYATLVFAYGQFAKLTWKEPRHKNGRILGYQVYGNGIVTTELPWWTRRHIIYDLNVDFTYEAKLRAKTSSGWGEESLTWFTTTSIQKPAKPLVPEVYGYGENSVNVTFMEPRPTFIRKYGGEIYDDPWEYRPVGGFENEHHGTGGYPARFYVLYRKAETEEVFKKTKQRQMWGEQEQTWIVIENLQRLTIYEFVTVPVNDQGEGPRSDIAISLPGGIVPKVKKLYWYQRDWFISLSVLFGAAVILFLVILFSTRHLKNIYYEGAPKRRKDRERERIYEPEDVTGGFDEFTLKSARSSRSVVTSRNGPPPPYSNGGTSRHSGDFDEDDSAGSDEDDEKHEVRSYYSDDKKVPLDDLDEDDEEDSNLATFV